MTVLSGAGLLVLGGVVNGVPFFASPPNGGESKAVSWRAIQHIGNSPKKLQRHRSQAARFSRHSRSVLLVVNCATL
jgi:hypothetical protein